MLKYDKHIEAGWRIFVPVYYAIFGSKMACRIFDAKPLPKPMCDYR